MKRLILFIFTVVLLLGTSLTSAEQQNLVYTLTVDYQDGKISISDIKLFQSDGPLDMQSDKGSYILKLFSFSEELLYQTNFGFQLELFGAPLPEWFDDQGNQIYIPDATETGVMALEESSLVLVVPYYSNAKKVGIFLDDERLAERDISEFSTCNENEVCDESETIEICPQDCTCGNGICDSKEDYASCSRDCTPTQEDGICEGVAEGICEPIGPRQSTLTDMPIPKWFLYALIGAVLGGLVLPKKRAKRRR